MPISVAGSRNSRRHAVITRVLHGRLQGGQRFPLRFPFAHQPGMTLIELLVGMAIVGVILAIVVGGLRDMTDAEMKTASSRLASTIRYLYNKSATERLYLRMVYDFEGHSYQVEATTEPFMISSSDLLEEDKQPAEEEEGEERDPWEEREERAEKAKSGEQEAFSEVESYLLKKVSLGDNIFFKDVHVSYAKEKIEEGKAYTYFLPNGFATPTVINLRDADDESHFSLRIMPLSGRVAIENRYRELNEPE